MDSCNGMFSIVLASTRGAVEAAKSTITGERDNRAEPGRSYLWFKMLRMVNLLVQLPLRDCRLNSNRAE
jgi:hypothetical protein